MRQLLPLLGLLAACAPDAVFLPEAGTSDVGSTTDTRTVEGGAGDAALDVAEDRLTPTDATLDVAEDRLTPTDAALDAVAVVDAVPVDTGPVVNLDVPVDRPDVVDVRTDTCASTVVGNCCGVACSTANGTPTCLGGACGVAACNAGYGDCDGDPANGCETALALSAAHCGACGAPCAAGRRCSASACVQCPAGQTMCGERCVDLRTSASDCGGCGNACSGAPNALAGCAGGACVLNCAGGYADCDSVATNGCEADTRTSASNCGGCGRGCAFPRACRNGNCGFF